MGGPVTGGNMLKDDELKRLFEDLESDRVERKESIDPKKVQQAICAFANDMPGHKQPGVLFIGVKDDGTCAGITIDDQLLLNLSQLRSTGNILPLPSMTVQKKTINGCEVAVVIVEPSTLPPVRFKGRTWIRVGPRRDTATVEEEHQLTERRVASNQPWDLAPLRPAKLDDLNLDLFKSEYLPSAIDADVLRENGRSIEQQLRSVRFLGPDNVTPTVTGLLAIGITPADYLPGDYIQFLRIDGTELSHPIIHQQAIYGPLSELLSELDVVLRSNIRIATDFVSKSTEIRRPDYPVDALQQLARNAIMHRNYETSNAPVRVYWFNDRIEIHNPGGPYGEVTTENFGVPGITDYRNPTVAEVMKNLGFVQRFGVGIATARNSLADNGNPELVLTASPTHVMAVVRRAP